jgi:transglutaminase-like putative cysteine protease
MDFDKLFRILSYATVFCGFFSLWIAGAFGIVGAVFFVTAMIASWFLEGSKLQVSERAGTVLIVLAVPLYYLLWRGGVFSFESAEAVLPSVLARLILTLSAIKLLQKKSDRDWIFLYIMAFFQVLLAAGLSISALYLVAFVAFVFFMVSTIILFEMRKTERAVVEKATVKRDELESKLRLPGFGRIPLTAFALIVIIIAIATPMFFFIPRVGGAGIGADPGGVSTRSGFSDRIQLGGIGRIQQNDEVVMRVRLDGNDTTGGLRWRGIALDTFDGQAWSKSRPNIREPRDKADRDIIQVDYATGRESLLLQTVYLEPLDTPVLFAAPRAVGVQGNFSMLMRDVYGAIYFQRAGERISYRVLSDTSLPPPQTLRADRAGYPVQFSNYLQLPAGFDKRIENLAASVTANARNRFDAAFMVENYLQTQFGYTLEQKAGGSDPVADFLFNVREGHCEYFATAMALMLRSQGVAARVVTGFQQGDYNETADVFVVRQRHAHAWVEVYFPGEETWVTFDPTPAAGQGTEVATAGLTDQFAKYLEALEMFWIQYFVAFDNQEQRSLFTSVKRGFQDYQVKTSSYFETLRILIAEWWKDVRGENGFETRAAAVGVGVGAFFLLVLAIVAMVSGARFFRRYNYLSWVLARFRPRRGGAVPDFYDRMIVLLAARGIVRNPHQTPLEFALSLGIPEAVLITNEYNRIRFGNSREGPDSVTQIDKWMQSLTNALPRS